LRRFANCPNFLRRCRRRFSSFFRSQIDTCPTPRSLESP
jgi:hypothetical protein